MFKKSIILISTILLSCFYYLSCKSVNLDYPVALKVNPSADTNIESYITKLRIVARSNNQACESSRRISTLGTPTKESEVKASFNDVNNFVDKNTNKEIILLSDCFSYSVEIGYWCKTYDKYPEGLCYKGESIVTIDNIKEVNGSKTLDLAITLKGQNGWENFQAKTDAVVVPVPVSDANYVSVDLDADLNEETTKLTDIISTECLFSSSPSSYSKSYAALKAFSNDSLNNKNLPFIGHLCQENPNQYILNTTIRSKFLEPSITSSNETSIQLTQKADQYLAESSRAYSLYLIKDITIKTTSGTTKSYDFKNEENIFRLFNYDNIGIGLKDIQTITVNVIKLPENKATSTELKTITWTKK